jgi:ribonuclease VapC
LILDSSALVAIALDEADRGVLVTKINAAPSVAVSAPTLVDTGILLSARLGADCRELVLELVTAADAVVIAFGPGHWEEAIAAWWRFGSSRHPASLNLGDCIAYATARLAGEPLLAKGGDFSKTDIDLA